MPSKLARLLAFFVFVVIGSTTASATAQPPLAQGEHHAILNGVTLWYKIAGQPQPGQAPVLFLHGGPGYNSYSFEKTIGSQLEPHMQLIYLDERGSGRSGKPANGDYSMPTLVADVEALRVSLGVPQLTLMGHSFGGTIALEYSALYPTHVQRLIILDGASDVPMAFALWRTELAQRYPAAWHKTLQGPAGVQLKLAESQPESENAPCTLAKAEFSAEMSTLQNANGQAFHNWQQFHHLRYQQQQAALDKASGLGNTGEIEAAYFSPTSQFPCYRFTAFDKLTMPALVIIGKFDGAIGEKQARALAAHLPHAQFDEFNDSAHFPYAEQPRKFTRDLTAFLNTAN